MSWLDGAEEIPTPKKAKAGTPAPSWMEGAEEVTPDILPDSPLAAALTASPDSETVEVDVDGEKKRVARDGTPVLSPEEFERIQDARTKLGGLQGTLSFMAGGGKGLTDDMAGYWEAIKSIGTDEDAADAHYRGKTNAQRLIAEADEAGPKAYGVPILPIAGAIASSGPTGVGALSRIAAGAYGGGLQGLGDSEKSGTGLFKDAGESALFAGALTAGGEALSGVAKGVGKYFGNKAVVNEGKVAAKAMAEAGADASSALGRSGSAGGTVQRGIEYVDAVLANPSGFTDEQVALAKQLAAEPAVIEARQRVAENAMRQLRSNIGWQQQTADEAGQLMATVPERAAAKTAQQLDPAARLADVGGKAWNSLGQRMAITAAGGAAGYVAGDALGFDPMKSGLAGLAAPGVLSFARNQVKNPANWAVLQRGVEGGFNAAANAGESLTGRAVRGVQEYQNQKRKPMSQEDDLATSAFLSGN